MDALILTVELAYREILSIEHTERLDYQQRKAKQYAMIIMMALREAKDTAGGYVFFMLLDHEWKTVGRLSLFYVPRDP